MSDLTPATFRPLNAMKSVSLSDSAAARISEMIHSGELPPGARLPAERDLASMLDLSRTALREGLHILETMGLLEARVGRGRFVANNVSDKSPPPISGWLQLHHVPEVIAVQRLLEPQAILELSADALPGICAEVRSCLREMTQAQHRGSHVAAATYHARFHEALIEQTPNRLLRGLCLSMLDVIRDSQYQIARTGTGGAHSVEQHRTILEALEKGDIHATAARIAEHLVPVFSYPDDTEE